MHIDFIETQKRCQIINYAAIARKLGISRAAVQLIVSGKYRRMTSPNAKAVLGIIRDMGLLVEVDDSDELIAA